MTLHSPSFTMLHNVRHSSGSVSSLPSTRRGNSDAMTRCGFWIAFVNWNPHQRAGEPSDEPKSRSQRFFTFGARSKVTGVFHEGTYHLLLSQAASPSLISPFSLTSSEGKGDGKGWLRNTSRLSSICTMSIRKRRSNESFGTAVADVA